MPLDATWRNRPRRPDTNTTGTLIRETRLRLNLTQHELALAAGVQGSFISKIETGRIKQPSFHLLGPLAAALRLPVEALYEAATGTPAPREAILPDDVRAFAQRLASVPMEDRNLIYGISHALLARAAA